MSEEDQVSRILQRVRDGENGAADALFACVFEELRALAQSHMNGQSPGHTLQPTALVNEAYLRLFRGAEASFEDRGHFLRAASRAMRCVLVDHARVKGRLKRSAPGERVPLDDLGEVFAKRARDLPALDAALERLAALDPRAAEVVELRFFGGRADEEIAGLLGVSLRTVERDWGAARAWLARELA